MISFSTFRKPVHFFQISKISLNVLKVVKMAPEGQLSFLWPMLICQAQPENDYKNFYKAHVNKYYRGLVKSQTQKIGQVLA